MKPGEVIHKLADLVNYSCVVSKRRVFKVLSNDNFLAEGSRFSLTNFRSDVKSIYTRKQKYREIKNKSQNIYNRVYRLRMNEDR